MKTKVFVVLAVAIGAVFLSTNAVTATPSVGFTAKVLAKGTLSKPTKMNALGVKFSTEQSTDVYVQQVDIAPAGISGWHEHPGLVMVVVMRRELGIVGMSLSPAPGQEPPGPSEELAGVLSGEVAH